MDTRSSTHHHPLLMLAALTVLTGAIVPAASAGPLTSGWRQVRYASVRFTVPVTWPVFDLITPVNTCILFNRHAVYLGNDTTSYDCPAHAIGRTEAIQVEPLPARDAAAGTPLAIGGQTARLLDDGTMSHAIVVAFPAAGVLATLSYGFDRPTAQAVLDSVRVLPGAPAAAATDDAAAGAAPEMAAGAPLTGASFTGKGFDTCGLGKVKDMGTWIKKSPYRAVGIYVGGANASCPAGSGGAAWVTATEKQGWLFIPVYVGIQAPCVDQKKLSHIDATQAMTQGVAAADDAVKLAAGLGFGANMPIYNDMESYNNTDKKCDLVTEQFLSGWTTEIIAKGYVSGVYGGTASTIVQLVKYVGSKQYASPHDIWFASWNGKATSTDKHIPAADWASHQRLHQYLGDKKQTYGGVTYQIDADYCDGALAS